MISVVSLALLALAAILLPSLTGSINPIGKAYVSSSSPNETFAEELKVAGWVEQRKAWIKFDFAEIPSDATITSATFRFYCPYIESHLGWNFIVGLFFASNAWSPFSITWTNQPAIETASWAEFNLGYIEEIKVGWHEASGILKDRIQTALQTDKKLTIVMQVKYARTGETFYATFTDVYIDLGYTTPPTPPTPPAPEYTLTLKVKDQRGNLLPAYVEANGQGKACENGEATISFDELKTVTVTATVHVGKKTFNTTQTVTLTETPILKEITITRRFFWKFYINYTDGTLPFGSLTASSNRETMEIPVTAGYGEAYLLDTTYTLTFEASPTITLKAITVTNDGTFYATINPETGKSETSTSEAPAVSTPTVALPEEITALLIQIIFIAVILLVIAIIISVVRSRKR